MSFLNLMAAGGFARGQYEGMLGRHKMKVADTKLQQAQEVIGINRDYLKIAQEDLGIRKEDLKIRQGEFGLKLDVHAMKREKFAWAQEDRKRKMFLQTGMIDASKSGGYEGVINFLKGHDPKQAIELHAEKLKLDAGMMKNEVYKAALPAEKAKVMMEGYKISGQIGLSMLNVPAEQRQKAWEAGAYKIASTIDPTISKDFNEAAPKLLLGQQLSHPGSIGLAVDKENASAQHNLNVVNKQLEALEVQGLGDSPKAQKLKALQSGFEEKAILAEQKEVEHSAKLARTQQQSKESKAKMTFKLQKQLDDRSKSFSEFTNNYVRLRSQFDVLERDPTNAAVQGSLGRMAAALVQKGILTDKDVSETIYSDALPTRTLGSIRAWLKGEGKLNLSIAEIGRLKASIESLAALAVSRQKGIEANFNNYSSSFKDVSTLNAENNIALNYYSDNFSRFKTEADQRSKLSRLEKKYPDLAAPNNTLGAKALAYIAAGKDEKWIMNKYQAEKIKEQGR